MSRSLSHLQIHLNIWTSTDKGTSDWQFSVMRETQSTGERQDANIDLVPVTFGKILSRILMASAD